MRLKIWCDEESWKILQNFLQLNWTQGEWHQWRQEYWQYFGLKPELWTPHPRNEQLKGDPEEMQVSVE